MYHKYRRSSLLKISAFIYFVLVGMTPEFPGVLLLSGFGVQQLFSIVILLLCIKSINLEPFRGKWGIWYEIAMLFMLWEFVSFVTKLSIIQPSEIFIPARTFYFIFLSIFIAFVSNKLNMAKNGLYALSLGILIASIYFLIGNYLLLRDATRWTYTGGFYDPSVRFINQNTLSYTISFCMPGVILFLVSSKGLIRSFLGISVILFLMITVFVCFSKGGVIGTAIAVLAMFLQAKPLRRLRYLVVLSIFAIVVLQAFPRLKNLNLAWEHRLETTSASVDTRKNFIATSSKIISDFPVFGVGYKNFLRYTSIYGGLGSRDPHNLYLHVSCGVGIPGIVILLLLIAVLGKSLFSIGRRCDQGQYLILCTMRSQFIVMLWLTMVSGFPFYQDIFWAYLGLYSGFLLQVKESWKFRQVGAKA